MLLTSLVTTHKKQLIVFLLVFVTLITFSPVLNSQFLSYKDDVFVTNNPEVSTFDFSHLLAVFKKRVDGIYTPVSTIWMSLERGAAGLNPFVFHANSLLLHLGVVVLVFYWSGYLGFSLIESFLCALLFAVFPSQVETVAWLSARKEIIGAVFLMAALYFFQHKKTRLSYFCALLAMLSTPQAILLPLILILIDWFQLRKWKILDKWVYLLLAIIFILINFKAGLSLVFNIQNQKYLFLEHLSYIPILALALFFTKGISRLLVFFKTQERIIQQLFIVALGVFFIGLMLLTYTQCSYWKNAETLWRFKLKSSKQAFVYNKLAQALEENKQTDSSVERINLYKKAIELEPRYLLSYRNIAGVYEQLGKLDDALLYVNKGLDIDGRSKELLFYLASLYRQMNKPLLVVESFNRLLKVDPDDEQVYIQVIKTYGQAIEKNPEEKLYQEQREQVLSDYELLSKRKKYTFVEYYNLGFLYEQVGGFEEAIRYYRKSLELKPSYEKSLLNLAQSYQHTGDFKSALLVYQQLLHFHPKNALAYLNLGIIYNAAGDVERSKMFYLKSINLDPSNAKPYFNLGYIAETAGELKDALMFYEKSIEKDSNQSEAYYNMGNVYARLGQEPEAMASYLKTIALDKNHQNAYVNLSILSFKSRDFLGAIHYLEEARMLGYNAPAEYLKSLEPYRKK